LWPTPTTDSATDRSKKYAQGGTPLTLAVKTWPTPQANKITRSGEIVNADGTPWDGIRKPHSKTTGKPITTALADAVMFATPQARDFRTGQRSRFDAKPRPSGAAASNNLNDQIGGQLNPNWTEWLMGWPTGFTASAPLATDKFQQWLRSHGVCWEGQTPIVCQKGKTNAK
jgi:hypothetical protein